MFKEIIEKGILITGAAALGATIMLLRLNQTVIEAEGLRQPRVIICDSILFEHENGTKEDKADPYFIGAATCTEGNANGREVIVKLID